MAEFYIQNQLVVKSPVIDGVSPSFQQMRNIQDILRRSGGWEKDTHDFRDGPIYTYYRS